MVTTFQPKVSDIQALPEFDPAAAEVRWFHLIERTNNNGTITERMCGFLDCLVTPAGSLSRVEHWYVDPDYTQPSGGRLRQAGAYTLYAKRDMGVSAEALGQERLDGARLISLRARLLAQPQVTVNGEARLTGTLMKVTNSSDSAYTWTVVT